MNTKNILFTIGVLVLMAGIITLVYFIGKKERKNDMKVKSLPILFKESTNTSNLNGAKFNDVQMNMLLSQDGDNIWLSAVDGKVLNDNVIDSTNTKRSGTLTDTANLFQYNNLTKAITKIVSEPNKELEKVMKDKVNMEKKFILRYNYCGLITLSVNMIIGLDGTVTLEALDIFNGIKAGDSGSLYGTNIQYTNALAGTTCRSGTVIQTMGPWAIFVKLI